MKSNFRKVSSDHSGLDYDQIRPLYFDLSIFTAREYITSAVTGKWMNGYYVVNMSIRQAGGLVDACGDMTNYCPPFYIPA